MRRSSAFSGNATKCIHDKLKKNIYINLCQNLIIINNIHTHDEDMIISNTDNNIATQKIQYSGSGLSEVCWVCEVQPVLWSKIFMNVIIIPQTQSRF